MVENKNFEEMMKDLENIAKDLESGDLSLDDSVKKFEEGMKIAKQCNTILDDAEKKITILLEKDGEAVLLGGFCESYVLLDYDCEIVGAVTAEIVCEEETHIRLDYEEEPSLNPIIPMFKLVFNSSVALDSMTPIRPPV